MEMIFTKLDKASLRRSRQVRKLTIIRYTKTQRLNEGKMGRGDRNGVDTMCDELEKWLSEEMYLRYRYLRSAFTIQVDLPCTFFSFTCCHECRILRGFWDAMFSLACLIIIQHFHGIIGSGQKPV